MSRPTFRPVLEPFAHQREEFERHLRDPARAWFWEQGIGKTKQALDEAWALWCDGEIDGLMVLAPEDLPENWLLEELPEHTPEELRGAMLALFWQPRKARTKWQQAAEQDLLKWRGLSVLLMNYSGFKTERGKKLAWKFLKKRRVLYVLDEASEIKSPGAKRTISVVASGKHAAYRRILEGTPVAEGPFDAYSPIRFLDENYWKRLGFATFEAYRCYFGEYGEIRKNRAGQEYSPLLGYRRLEELGQMLEPIASRIQSADVLDLPEQLYAWEPFQLSDEWQRVYDELKSRSFALLSEGGEADAQADLESYIQALQDGFEEEEEEPEEQETVTADLPIVLLLRLQQVCSGYVMTDGGELRRLPGPNPRLDALSRAISRPNHGKTIVWAPFRQQIEDCVGRLEEMGRRPVRYDGTVPKRQRREIREEFKRGTDVTEIVANPSCLGRGHTFTVATRNVFYANSYRLRLRLQSEKRIHRSGQEHPCLNIDIAAPGTTDQKAVKALRKKFDVSREITGDTLREWLK